MTQRFQGQFAAAVAAVMIMLAPTSATAAPQQPDPPPDPPAQPTISDRAVDPSQPDFTLVGLPTNLRMPKYASAFRVTHRFTRSLGQGDFGDLLGDAFGVDGGAQVGLEYRFGLFSGTQIGIHRTSDRTIQLFAQHQLLREGESMPITLDVLGSIDGTNNFRDSYSPAIGAVISRKLGRHGAAYFEPIWINNSNPFPSELVDDNNTFMFGVGTRLRVLSTVYLVGEAAPRIGNSPGKTYLSFAIEKRAGGHSFQINFSNNFGTTLNQIAQGAIDYDVWYLGFNISRKFF
jgi:Membrane bound beta barrel domain (DUF5777)